jgi:hypothetical protein
MPDFSIRMDLLLPTEQQALAQLGADLLPSGIAFSRRLSEAQMLKVGRILDDLRYRTNDDDNNHIGFAIGDWGNQTDEWFGEGKAIEWMMGLQRLKRYRNWLLRLTGATMIQLQFLEYLIKTCCAVLRVEVGRGNRKRTIEIDDILSSDAKRRRVTLGLMKEALRDKGFTADFENLLGTFVEKRNRFIHSYWVDIASAGSESDPPSAGTLDEIEEFTTGVLEQATEIQKVFQGFLFAWSKEASRTGERDESLRAFLQFQPDLDSFLSVWRGRDES